MAGDSAKGEKRKWNRYGSLKTSAQPMVVHLGTNAQPFPVVYYILTLPHPSGGNNKCKQQGEVVHLDTKCTGKVVHFGK